jgi:hypothetical protein
MSKSKIKTMLICFFNIRVIIHFEFVPEGTTVNHTFYMEVLKRFVERSLIDSSPQQHAGMFFTSNVAVFSKKRHLCHGSSTELS